MNQIVAKGSTQAVWKAENGPTVDHTYIRNPVCFKELVRECQIGWMGATRKMFVASW